MKPPTKKELAWCAELESVLMRAPKRVDLVTIGDAHLIAVDKAIFRACQDEQLHVLPDCTLAEISSSCNIHGIAG